MESPSASGESAKRSIIYCKAGTELNFTGHFSSTQKRRAGLELKSLS